MAQCLTVLLPWIQVSPVLVGGDRGEREGNMGKRVLPCLNCCWLCLSEEGGRVENHRRGFLPAGGVKCIEYKCISVKDVYR